MHPDKIERSRVKRLTDLPNIGKAGAADLQLLGIHEPQQLRGKSALQMYEQLCQLTQSRQDPCVLDVFMSITRFMNGEEPRPWWAFTAERKQLLGKGVAIHGVVAGPQAKNLAPSDSVRELQARANLGPKSAQMLVAAGIRSFAHLTELGSVAAFVQVKRSGAPASLNLLWALEGALSGERWQVVAREHRTSLLLALESCESGRP